MTFDLKRWREILGVSKDKAAEVLGVRLSTYSQWETQEEPIPEVVVTACTNYLVRYPGNGYGMAKAILKARDEYKFAYELFFKKVPIGEHLVGTPWLHNKYRVINFTPCENINANKVGGEHDFC